MEVTMFLVFALSFVLSLSLIVFIKQWLEIKDLKLQKQIAENDVKIVRNMYRDRIYILQGQIQELSKMRIVQNPNIPPNTVQAVKYAMRHAHPDNGGNVEDFIKFQKCYEELMREGGADRPKTCLDMMQMTWVDTS